MAQGVPHPHEPELPQPLRSGLRGTGAAGGLSGRAGGAGLWVGSEGHWHVLGRGGREGAGTVGRMPAGPGVGGRLGQAMNLCKWFLVGKRLRPFSTTGTTALYLPYPT